MHKEKRAENGAKKHGSAPKPDQTQKCIKKRTHREVPETQDKKVSIVVVVLCPVNQDGYIRHSTKREVY